MGARGVGGVGGTQRNDGSGGGNGRWRWADENKSVCPLHGVMVVVTMMMERIVAWLHSAVADFLCCVEGEREWGECRTLKKLFITRGYLAYPSLFRVRQGNQKTGGGKGNQSRTNTRHEPSDLRPCDHTNMQPHHQLEQGAASWHIMISKASKKTDTGGLNSSSDPEG